MISLTNQWFQRGRSEVVIIYPDNPRYTYIYIYMYIYIYYIICIICIYSYIYQYVCVCDLFTFVPQCAKAAARFAQWTLALGMCRITLLGQAFFLSSADDWANMAMFIQLHKILYHTLPVSILIQNHRNRKTRVWGLDWTLILAKSSSCPWSAWVEHPHKSRKLLLVGGFNPSEKYSSIGMIIPNRWKRLEK